MSWANPVSTIMDPGEPAPSAIVDAFLASTGLKRRSAIVRDVVAGQVAAVPSFETVIELVDKDGPLSKRLIHLANSAWFGSRVEVDSAANAFGRLGVEKFCTLCVSSVARQSLQEVSDSIWPHLEFTAEFCEIFSQRVAPEIAVDAYWAGLFHDYMVPFMVKALPDYCYWAEGAIGTDDDVIANELECYGFTHVEAGAALLREWGFNIRVAEAVSAHHRHGGLARGISPDGARIAALLAIAERVAESSGRQSGGLPSGLEADSGVLAETGDILGLGAVDLKEHINEMCALVAVRAMK
jgi:HD-like signal output (HDOD) protein